MAARVWATALVPALFALAACGEFPQAEAALSPYEQLAADSAAADSAAFDNLPPGLAPILDLREELQPSVLDSHPLVECLVLEPRGNDDLRRRLRLRLADSTVVVLYAVADKTSGTLDRVEFLRRTPLRGQRGLIWDSERDRVTSVWWAEFDRGYTRRSERGELPRSGSAPRAVRALGRTLLTLPCADSASVG